MQATPGRPCHELAVGDSGNDCAMLEAAETLYLKASELSPNYATAWHWYSLLLDRLHRHQESL